MERIVIVCDGTAWHVRRLLTITHDLDNDQRIYRCDEPISSDHPTLADVPQVKELLYERRHEKATATNEGSRGQS